MTQESQWILKAFNQLTVHPFQEALMASGNVLLSLAEKLSSKNVQQPHSVSMCMQQYFTEIK